ncbi:hypothetical protein C8R45DRAFT_936765 [Mycena sanguinolenta]|nr:hypothetical protein C8R45DRAFT_936765 [Mycena sanguinolenta]
MQWGDTVGHHSLGTLSRITFSVSLLGGAAPNANPAGLSRKSRGKDKAMQEAILADLSVPDSPKAKRHKRKRRVKPTVPKDGDDGDSSEDKSFEGSDEDGASESSDSEADIVVEGAEKTNPNAGSTRDKGKAKEKPQPQPPKKRRRKAAATTEAEASPSSVPQAEASTSSKKPRKTSSRPKHPLWHFFDGPVEVDDAEEGLKYYRCRLGKKQNVSVTDGARGNYTNLRNHLRAHFSDHFRMYLVWTAKDAAPPSNADIEVARGNAPMTPDLARRYQDKAAKVKGNIGDAFRKGKEAAMVEPSALLYARN